MKGGGGEHPQNEKAQIFLTVHELKYSQYHVLFYGEIWVLAQKTDPVCTLGEVWSL